VNYRLISQHVLAPGCIHPRVRM